MWYHFPCFPTFFDHRSFSPLSHYVSKEYCLENTKLKCCSNKRKYLLYVTITDISTLNILFNFCMNNLFFSIDTMFFKVPNLNKNFQQNIFWLYLLFVTSLCITLIFCFIFNYFLFTIFHWFRLCFYFNLIALEVQMIYSFQFSKHMF